MDLTHKFPCISPLMARMKPGVWVDMPDFCEVKNYSASIQDNISYAMSMPNKCPSRCS